LRGRNLGEAQKRNGCKGLAEKIYFGHRNKTTINRECSSAR
jgi:hypothetical protein